MKWKALMLALSIGGLLGAGAKPALATKPDPNHKVVICHRTASQSNPYVQISVDEASVNMDTGDDNGKGDHNAQHQGPVFPAVGEDGKWGDIIPPFYANGDEGYWPSLNWDEEGQVIWENGCNLVTESPSPTVTPSPSDTPSPTETPSPSDTPTGTHTPKPTKTGTSTPPTKSHTSSRPGRRTAFTGSNAIVPGIAAALLALLGGTLYLRNRKPKLS